MGPKRPEARNGWATRRLPKLAGRFAQAGGAKCLGQLKRPTSLETRRYQTWKFVTKVCKGGAEVAPGQGDAMEQGKHRKREREQVQQP